MGASSFQEAQPISYVAVGPVFGTRTKATGYEAVGLAQVHRAAAAAHGVGLPLVTIGGITLDRAHDVLTAGADAVAVISDLLPVPPSRAFTPRARQWVTSLRRD